MTRKKVSKKLEADILVQSRRRCCICFGLARNLEVKSGQIAHLDHDSSNNAADNLAFLCLEHHDKYDSKTSQSKNYTITEVKRYRDELYDSIIPIIENHKVTEHVITGKTKRDEIENIEYKNAELKQVILEILSERPYPHSLFRIAKELSVPKMTVERVLHQLVLENVVRGDRERGRTTKKYSLKNSLENRIIDTFLETLNEKIISEQRYFRKNQFEFDCIIETRASTYVVEVIVAREELSEKQVERTVSRLDRSKKALKFTEAKSVLLVGITAHTNTEKVDLNELMSRGIMIKYIELDQEYLDNFIKKIKG
jgi:DNA-binding transcriptional regulator YhcF (GntR family)